MDAQQKEIIKKIQKLLRLAEKAGSEDEAHTAMSMARDMLAKYNLSLGDVNAFSEEECKEAAFTIKSSYTPAHVKILIQAMNLLYQTRTTISYSAKNRNRRIITFIGVGADAIVASHMFQFLLEFAKRKAMERAITQKGRADYFYGFAYSVRERAWNIHMQRNENRQEYALVPLKDGALDRYMDKHYANTTNCAKMRKRDASADLFVGLRDGNKANLDRQVGTVGKTAIR